MTELNPLDTATVQLVRVACSCGGVYAITEAHRAEAHRAGTSWTCPYCKCSWGYLNNGENARLRRELEQEKARSQRRLEAAEAARRNHAAECRRRIATKGALTRTKNRIAHGVCPCCKRTFAALAAHMKAKHPAYVGKGEAGRDS